MTNSQLITKYANYNAGRLSQASILAHCLGVKDLCEYLNKPLCETSNEDISNWIQSNITKGYSKWTIKEKVGSVHCFFNWCSDQQMPIDVSLNDNSFYKYLYKINNERNEDIEKGTTLSQPTI